nr:uncharacterized protein LOC127340046 [Lolium perenne]
MVTLTDEQRAEERYRADNYDAWNEFFRLRHERELAAFNGPPLLQHVTTPSAATADRGKAPASLPPLGDTGGGANPGQPPPQPHPPPPLPSPVCSVGQSPRGAGGGRTRFSSGREGLLTGLGSPCQRDSLRASMAAGAGGGAGVVELVGAEEEPCARRPGRCG